MTLNPASGSPPRSAYRPELDALRFFAFLAVFLFHTFLTPSGTYDEHWWPSLARSGYFGVDLFFVLSSYLITDLLLRERVTHGSISVRRFYMRRMLRIWPLYFFFIAIAVWAGRTDPAERLSRLHLVGLLFFSYNWLLLLHPAQSLAIPLWSLAIEEQFYLIWPWVILKANAKTIQRAAGASLVVAMVTRIALGLRNPQHDVIWMNTLAHLDPLAGGTLLAVFLRGRLPELRTTVRLVLLMGGLVLWVLYSKWGAFLHYPTSLIGILGFPLLALGCVMITVAVLGVDGSVLARIFHARILVYLGRISYGLYVFQALGFWFVERHLQGRRAGWDESFTQLARSGAWAFLLTLGFAAASYQFLEKPFLRLKQRFSAIPAAERRRL